MARTKHNGVRDGALTFKKRTGVDLNPLVRATPEELAKYNADWKRLRAKWAREKEELRKKEWEVMEAYWAKMDIEEKEKPRRPCSFCRRRKIKCNRADFCDQCLKRGRFCGNAGE